MEQEELAFEEGRKFSKREGSVSGASGRDELNLSEFPLCVLSDHVPEGLDAIVLEDRVWDKGTKQWVDRKLTITGPKNPGLPTFKDSEVLTGLIQCSAAAKFADRRVPYRVSQIIEILGWRDEGWSYNRIRDAIKRWASVTLEFQNAWWDKDQGAWMTERFHIIDNLTTVERDDGTKENVFVWNEVVWKSFQAGYVKPLDLSILRQLRSPIAYSLYRLLDKHFHHSSRRRFDLAMLGHQKFGLSRAGGIGKLKQTLERPISELEGIGFIKAAAKSERYRKRGPGSWDIVFEKAAAVKEPPDRKLNEFPEIQLRMEQLGLTPDKAAQLVSEFPHEFLVHKIEVVEHLLSQGKEKAPANPAGFLVASIREDYKAPADFVSPSELAKGRAEATDARMKNLEFFEAWCQTRRSELGQCEDAEVTRLLEYWEAAKISLAIPAATARAWIDPLRPIACGDGVFEIAAPSGFIADYVENAFAPKLAEAWRKTGHPDSQIRFSHPENRSDKKAKAAGRASPISA